MKETKIKTMLMLAITAIVLSSAHVSTTLANAQISEPTPEELQALEELRQLYAMFERQLSLLSSEQQQAAIFGMQQQIMAGFLQTPPELVPQEIQTFELTMSPQLAQAVLYPVLAQLQAGQQQPISPPSNVTSVPPSAAQIQAGQQTQQQEQQQPISPPVNITSAPQCPGGLTNDPLLNQNLCKTNSLISNRNPQNDAYKDSTYTPPLTQEELWNKCWTQATSSNLVPDSYCAGMLQYCLEYRFTVEECYAYSFVKLGVSSPYAVMEGIGQKTVARGAQIDAVYKAIMCPYKDGTYGEYCFE
jgi:hypothetical protein